MRKGGLGPMILLIDNDLEHTTKVASALGREGYPCHVTTSGRLGIEAALSAAPRLVMLDVTLPDISGNEVCRELRYNEATRSTPLMFLASQDSEIDRVVAFEIGADDYVRKAGSLRELALRVKAILGRYRSCTRGAKREVVQFEKLQVDLEAHQVWVDGKEIPLTIMERKLVYLLMTRRGQVQTRPQLLSDVWGLRSNVTTRTVDTHVKRLRDKLGPVAGEYLETVRGVGYRFKATTSSKV